MERSATASEGTCLCGRGSQHHANRLAPRARRSIGQPAARVGDVLTFADGSRATVYRETVVSIADTADPAVLIVCFRLRWIRGWGHRAFRAESLLNTPLFVGFPGFVSKLWLANDEHGVYRGVYQWNDASLADGYARALWRVLALVCTPGSIHYVVMPGRRRDEVLANPPLPSPMVADLTARR